MKAWTVAHCSCSILGIETSCDETAAAVVEETGDASAAVGDPLERRRLSSRRFTASGAAWCPSWRRGSTARHLRRRRARAGARPTSVARSRRRRGDPGAGPGRARCSSACRSPKSLAWSHGLPLVPVHHLAGHIESLVLQHGELPLPAAVLVVSGGHTSLYLVASRGPVPTDRPHARRCGGRGVRQGRQAARPRLSRRTRDRSTRRGRATIARTRCRCRA